ncbi:MAG TPA: DUF2309 domain-containing protein [Bacteroidia bacterium]|nr:DUF2309 domain-containing protein [Bacteroidia bacterium]
MSQNTVNTNEVPGNATAARSSGQHGKHHFDEAHVLHELKHYLPTQTPLKDFIHHNTLHAFQQQKFYDAIFHASGIFGYQVTLELDDYRKLYQNGRIKANVVDRVVTSAKGASHLNEWKNRMLTKAYNTVNHPRIGELRAEWKSTHGVELDYKVHPLLFRILAGYLDQGISSWKFPMVEGGFLASMRELEKNSFTSLLKTRRAKELLLNTQTTIISLLRIVVGNEAYFERYLFDQQFSHQGWSGLVSAVEDAPHGLPDTKPISLHDLIVFELILEIDALESKLGSQWEPLCSNKRNGPADLFAPTPSSELREVFSLWQDAFEWSYYDEVLQGVRVNAERPVSAQTTKSFQAVFCIDERECSLRRHIEYVNSRCETLGWPGFFSVEFYFQPEHAKFYDKLCPAPVTPGYLIKETGSTQEHKHELLYNKHGHSLFLGTLMTITLGFWAGIKLFFDLFRPKMTPAISNASSHMGQNSHLTIENTNPNNRENGLQIGFTVQEMAARVESLLRGTGMIRDFAPIVYILGHGSSSANNPHHGAHDCGACSGRPGSVNARVFAFMANHKGVRTLLGERGIEVPQRTVFIGGMHDTASDQIEFYDERKLTGETVQMHAQNRISFEHALDLDAKERSRRFASINTKMDIKKVREAIRKRSVSFFEPRPELGHGTNALCIIGRRKITRGLYLDRRAFLNSYDYTTDPEGKLLLGIMRPIGVVCGGINLEYYFSRVDINKFGAGTKLPHNVTGLFGVTNSSDGDLRPGLPQQMIEPHDPVRLMVIVEHFPEVVLKTIQSVPEVYEWYVNEWVHISALHPETNEFHYFKNGEFVKYDPLTKEIPVITSFEKLFENAPEMESAHITDATKENLPVYLIN